MASENNINIDSDGLALECPSCGAPSNGLSRCQWCGSSIPHYNFKKEPQTAMESAPKNKTINNIAKGFSDAVYTISGIKI